MNRRAALFAVLIALALGGGVWLLRGSSDDASPDERRGATAEAAWAAPAPQKSGLFGAAPPRAALVLPRRARIAGKVVDGAGKAVPDAEVAARGPSASFIVTGQGGAFSLPELEGGEYTLFARKGGLASDPVGPIPVARGEELRDLTIVLDSGAALSGTITAGGDGAPIARATVHAGAASGQTDERGRYRIAGLPSGKVTLEASADGFVARSLEVALTKGHERTGADLHLDRGGKVHGVVLSGGMPVPGAQIFSAHYGFGSRLAALTPIAVSDGEGKYSGTVKPGRLELVAQHPSYSEGRTDEFELGAGEDHEANFTLGAGGVLFGSVRDARGASVAGCRIDAFDSVHGRTTQQGTSGADGRYWIAGVPTALYIVAASCALGRAELTGISVREGDSAQVDLTLGEGLITGRVVDGHGGPVVGATVAAKSDGSPAPETPLSTTRADGSFELHGLSGQRFTVSATAPQGKTERSGVVAGTKDLLLTLASGELVGVVVSSQGDPVTDFTIYVESLQLHDTRPRSQRFFSPTGEFRFPLAPAKYGCQVGAPGYAALHFGDVEVPAGGTTSRIKVVLQKAGLVRGKVVNDKGQGLAGVNLATHPNYLWAFGRSAPLPGPFTTSDADGSFALTGVPPGTRVNLFTHREGFEQKSTVAVQIPESGAAEGVEVKLFPTHRDDNAEKEFGGVGMSLGERDGHTWITDVFSGGPAREAGVRPGDELLAVDGQAVRGLSMGEVINRIRGVVGTTVILQLQRSGRDFALSISRVSVKF